MNLNHRVHQSKDVEAQKWLFLLHGFLGKGRNWESIARKIVSARPDWGVVTPDLRLHGDSLEIEGPHDLQSTAEDLVHLAQELNIWPDALAGHSFGGKVVLEATKLLPNPAQVWVLDSTPSKLIPAGAAFKMVKRMRRLPGPFGDRKAAVATLMADGLTSLESQWMATNLHEVGGAYQWRLDIDALDTLLTDFYAQDLWDVIAGDLAERFVFVKASQSGILDDEALGRLQDYQAADKVIFETLEGGHWLNVANPQGLLALFEKHLP